MFGFVLPALAILVSAPLPLHLSAPPDLSPEGKLHSAAWRLDATRVRDLLQKGVSPHKYQILPYIARRGDKAFAVMKLLLEAGVSVNNGRPLQVAISSPNPSASIVRLLISHKCKIGPDAWELGSPLHDAISLNKLNLVKILIEGGANIEGEPVADYSGRRPLSVSAGSMLHRPAMFDYLLEKGAKTHSVDREGNTPLHYASRAKNFYTIRRLLATGASVHQVNEVKRTPLHEAVSGHCYGQYYKAVKLLLDNGADRNVRDENGKTALDLFLVQIQEMRTFHAEDRIWVYLRNEKHRMDLFRASFELDAAATEQLLKAAP